MIRGKQQATRLAATGGASYGDDGLKKKKPLQTSGFTRLERGKLRSIKKPGVVKTAPAEQKKT